MVLAHRDGPEFSSRKRGRRIPDTEAKGFRLLRISSYFFSTVSPYPQKSKLESIDRRDGIDHRAIEGNSPTLSTVVEKRSPHRNHLKGFSNSFTLVIFLPSKHKFQSDREISRNVESSNVEVYEDEESTEEERDGDAGDGASSSATATSAAVLPVPVVRAYIHGDSARCAVREVVIKIHLNAGETAKPKLLASFSIKGLWINCECDLIR
ncbi:hypothetical protein HZH68_001804 [Vespula germanica]|uniref:Uncharacterized protein n=1 Tax=Vespula germanica TaxID=30212 RepID=A0A834NWE0_VESGE|nr:hypothetical protein HZH68_001804 [Vespula germanica]